MLRRTTAPKVKMLRSDSAYARSAEKANWSVMTDMWLPKGLTYQQRSQMEAFPVSRMGRKILDICDSDGKTLTCTKKEIAYDCLHQAQVRGMLPRRQCTHLSSVWDYGLDCHEYHEVAVRHEE